MIDQHVITSSSSSKDLGIVVDTSLKFHQHIQVTINKASSLAYNLLKSTLCRTPNFMVTLYKTHIRPIIEFGSTVWNTGYIGDVKALESVQRRWTKKISGFSDVPYSERLSTLNLYSVYGRLCRADIIKYWKIFHNLSPIKPEDLFSLSRSSTRGHRYKLNMPRCHLEVRKRYFSIRCIKLWNSLPDDVVAIDSLPSFKASLHTWLSHHLFFYFD